MEFNETFGLWSILSSMLDLMSTKHDPDPVIYTMILPDTHRIFIQLSGRKRCGPFGGKKLPPGGQGSSLMTACRP